MHNRGRETHCVVRLRLVATMFLYFTAKKEQTYSDRGPGWAARGGFGMIKKCANT